MKLSVMIAVATLAAGPVAGTVFAQSNSATAARPSDAELSRQIASKIASDKSLTPDAVKVTVNGGVATLTGMVATNADVSRIGELARVQGVTRVENKLTSRDKAVDKVKEATGVNARPKAGTQGKTSDEELSKSIASKISSDKSLTPDAVKVTVNGGVVTLSGIVAKTADIARAGRLARMPGVVRVDNKLTSREKATDKVKDVAGDAADATKKGAKKTADVTKKAAEKTKDAVTGDR
jgi:osmotically-inducible protein OsmY